MFDFSVDYKDTKPFSSFQYVCLYLAIVPLFLINLYWRLYHIPPIPNWLTSLGIAAIVILVFQKGRLCKAGMLMSYIWIISCCVYSLLFLNGIIVNDEQSIEWFVEQLFNDRIFDEELIEMAITNLPAFQEYVMNIYIYGEIGAILWCVIGLFVIFLRTIQKILPALFLISLILLPVIFFGAMSFV